MKEYIEERALGIANCIIEHKDAPFIILDEPTAALDPIAEFEVYNRMNQMIVECSGTIL